jgi:hypothetical protein
MPTEQTTGIRITFWRPHRPARPLAFQPSDSLAMFVLGSDEQLQIEAFSWHVKEDIWGGLLDPILRDHLNRRLVDEFDPSLSPIERTIEKMQGLLTQFATALPGTEWSAAGYDTDEDEEAGSRLNSLLAFHEQMVWLCNVFKQIPGASVSVR